jgi:hypothetical protein
MRPLALRLALLAPALVATTLLGACSSGKSSGTAASGASGSPTAGASAGASSGASGAGTATGSATPDATGTGATGGGGVGKRDACKVLTGQDAAAILGQPVGAAKDGSALGIPYPSCTYTTTGGNFQTVGLTIFDAAATANLINQYKQQFPDMATLPGVGDAAVSEGDGRLVVATKGGVGCVMLRAGDVTGSVSGSTQLMAGVCKKVFAGS